jgi:hypothetical protein
MGLRSFYNQVVRALGRTAPSFHYRQETPREPPSTFMDRPRPLVVLLTGTAASLLAITTVVFGTMVYRYASGEEVWGWDRPGALATANQLGTKSAYFNQLAMILAEWEQKRRPAEASSADQVEQRLAELYKGCLALLSAKHEPLAKADQKWLQDKCQTWLEQIHNQRVALALGKDPQEVRDTMQSLVQKMHEELGARASQA